MSKKEKGITQAEACSLAREALQRSGVEVGPSLGAKLLGRSGELWWFVIFEFLDHDDESELSFDDFQSVGAKVNFVTGEVCIIENL